MVERENEGASAARERFVHLAQARTRKTIKDLRLIGNLSNRSNYSYDERDIAKIFKAIEDEVRANRLKFESARSSKKDIDFTL
jgi:hypothetical protein